MKFLILLAQAHESFRIAELEALADLFHVEVAWKDLHYDPGSPFLIVDLKSWHDAEQLVHRSILCRAVYEYYGQGSSLDQLHLDIKSRYTEQDWLPYKTDSFKFDVQSYQGSRARDEQIAIIESFKYMSLDGPIRMKKAQHVFTVFEQYEDITGREAAEEPLQVYFGRLVCESSRHIVEKYDLKKRRYIGTTSFDAELSLVTCNLAQVSRDKFVYDPFVGTGSFLVAAGHFGGLCVGSDIDVRMVKGKDQSHDVPANFSQYKMTDRFLDVAAIDFTNNAFRASFKFDAIVCDPPYGVREGLKVLGSKYPERFAGKEVTYIDGVPAHSRRDYIPPKKPYTFGLLLDNLLDFASRTLVPNGRLSFWMPTANDDSVPNNIPQHEDLELMSCCVQEFNKWSRRLLTYRRRLSGDKGAKFEVRQAEEFRDKYFRGFRDSAQTTPEPNSE